MKIELSPYEAAVVRIALKQAISFEVHEQETYPELVCQADENFLHALQYVYDKLS